MLNTITIITIIVALIALGCFVLFRILNNKEPELACLFMVFSGITGIISIILMCAMICKADVPSRCEVLTITNNRYYPVKAIYLKFHMCYRPTLESTILMPGESKIIYDADAREVIPIKFDGINNDEDTSFSKRDSLLLKYDLVK